MPQLILEFSSNIYEKENIYSLLKQFNEALTQGLPTELSSCKSRAIEHTVFCIGDGNINNAFVHINLKVMPGRSQEKLQSIGQEMIEILKKFFHTSSQKFSLQLTLEIEELKKTYFKLSSKV